MATQTIYSRNNVVALHGMSIVHPRDPRSCVEPASFMLTFGSSAGAFDGRDVNSASREGNRFSSSAHVAARS